MGYGLGWLKPLSAVLIAMVLASSGSAGIIFTVQQSGDDILVEVSGSLSNLTASGGFATSAQGTLVNNVNNGQDMISVSDVNENVNYYTISRGSRPASFWFSNDMAINGVASITGLGHVQLKDFTGFKAVYLSADYVQGTSISGSLRFLQYSLSSFGPNYGDYLYTLNSGGDTVTLRILDSSSAVPEPTSMAIFGMGAVGLAYRARRKRMQ